MGGALLTACLCFGRHGALEQTQTSQAEWPGVAWGAESPGPGPRAAGGRSCGLAMQVASAKSSGKPGLNPGSAFYQMCDPGHSTHLLPSKPAFCSTVPAPWAQGALEETTGKGQQPLVLVGSPRPTVPTLRSPGPETISTAFSSHLLCGPKETRLSDVT